uniref:Glutaredoxin domain-containing protein n=1 Tax=Romanomermis culicivorax TaxID=13658 RepID=A0A915K4X1_ROMCU
MENDNSLASSTLSDERDLTIFVENRHHHQNLSPIFFQKGASGGGSIRGVKNKVKMAMDSLKMKSKWKKNYEELEDGKVVVYMTSLRVIRPTWESCRSTISILENHSINFERRDVNLYPGFWDELKNRLDLGNDGDDDNTAFLELPQIFVDGVHFADAKRLCELTELGQIKNILAPYMHLNKSKSLCGECYGFQFVPCRFCHGGKKSNLRIDVENYRKSDSTTTVNDINLYASLRLKCTKCDSSGLIRCDACSDGFAIANQ